MPASSGSRSASTDKAPMQWPTAEEFAAWFTAEEVARLPALAPRPKELDAPAPAPAPLSAFLACTPLESSTESLSAPLSNHATTDVSSSTMEAPGHSVLFAFKSEPPAWAATYNEPYAVAVSSKPQAYTA